jgi:outer membrane protein TolC
MQISPGIAAAIAQTKEEYAAGRINYEAARRETEFQVRRLYCQILLLKANVELAEQNAATAESRYRQINAQYRTGQASNLDELSARLDAQTQKTNILSAQAAYNNALDSLKYLLIIPAEEKFIPEGDLQIFFVIAQAPDVQGAESLHISALRKTIAALKAQRTSARINSYAPSLNFSWNASPLYSDTSGGWVDNGGQFSISLSIKLDNYLPWSPAKEQIDSLSDAITAQQSALAEAALNHQNTIQKLMRNIAQSTETIETLRLNVTLAEENHKMHEDSYRKGAADLQSLYNARDSVSLAHNKLLSEQYNLISAILELEKELNFDFGSIGRFE